MRQHAQAVLAQLVAFQKQREQYEEVRKSSGSSGIAGGGNNSSIVVTNEQEVAAPQDASSYLREVLRKPAAGETQLQGTLLRIECAANGIIFVVKAGTQTLRLHTPNFELVEITTYNPEVKGDLGCGVRNPEDRIVVCFKAQSDKRLKSDGVLKSIEFVPASFKLAPSE